MALDNVLDDTGLVFLAMFWNLGNYLVVQPDSREDSAQNIIIKESNPRLQPPILPRTSKWLKDHSLILSKIVSLNHTISNPGVFHTELHIGEKNG